MFSQMQSIDVEIEQKNCLFPGGLFAEKVAVQDIREINKICGIIYYKLKFQLRCAVSKVLEWVQMMQLLLNHSVI